jgi:hypothetical protein
MNAKHMDVACYSILLVAVAIVGIQLTSPGSVSGQEEEESFIASIAQDGQNAQDRTHLTTPASVSGQEEEESTITPLAQDDQNAQNGPGVFPRIAGLDDDSAEVANSADVTGSGEAANGEDVTGSEKAANGEDFENDVDSGVGNGPDAANDRTNQKDGAGGTNNQNGGAGGTNNQNGGAGGTNNADGTDLANGGFGANGADGVGRDGVDGATEAADGKAGVDAFALQLEAVIP